MFCSLNLYFFDVPVAVVVVVSYVVDMFIHKNYLGQFLFAHFQISEFSPLNLTFLRAVNVILHSSRLHTTETLTV